MAITKQDMSIDCEYVMFPQFKKSTLYYSYLSVFTRDGTRVGLIELYEDSKIYYEVEDCFTVAGELYFAYYCSGYGFRLYRADIKIG